VFATATQNAQHANQFGHSMDFDCTTIVRQSAKLSQEAFSQSVAFTRDQNAGDEQIDIPDTYKSLG